VLTIECMLEHLREVKVEIFWEKDCNLLEGMVDLLERLSDVRFNRKRDIWHRSLLRSP